MVLTNAQKQAQYRARKASNDLSELRNQYLTSAETLKVKIFINKLILKREKRL